ncbi:MAG: fumarylacetoacetate hydrolase family protein [Actinomycetota bacterium]|nr:fumarylacetoacetate hydrolase family protein [Actinomycetota bacterium]
MRLVSLKTQVGSSAGVVVDDEVLDLAEAVAVLGEDPLPSTLKGVIEGGDAALDRLRRIIDKVASSDTTMGALRARSALVPFTDAVVGAPIPDPTHVLSCGMSYRQHLHEMGGTPPDTPTAFLKSPAAVVGPGDPIVLPAQAPDMVDWEAEFCGVIGRHCHNVTEAEALDHIVGYTMINDVSARNWVRPMHELQGLDATKAWDLNLLGKQFPSFCPLGPAIATKDELDPTGVTFQLRLNGTLKQSACTDDLAFSLAYLVSYYSQWYHFRPGDVISTGTPGGVGMGERPFLFLKPGDEVTITGDRIGTMTNPVVAADA